MFYLLNYYSEDNGTSSNRMSPIALTKMLKDFNVLNNSLNKEHVGVIYSKRCKRSLIDFAAYIDILYKISSFFLKEITDRTKKFRVFLDEYILDKISEEVMSKRANKPSFSKIEVFDLQESMEHDSLKLFERGDDLLKHVPIVFEFFFGGRFFKNLINNYNLILLLNLSLYQRCLCSTRLMTLSIMTNTSYP